jgi:hypothetical protein
MGLVERLIRGPIVPEEWGQLLTEWAQEDRQLPRAVVEFAGAHLAELGPHLAGLVANEALWEGGLGGAPALAARVLGELQYKGAIPALLKAAEQVPEFTPLGDAIIDALFDLGEAVREGLYGLAERHQAHVESIPYSRALEVLAGLKRDERTWQYLKRGLQEAAALTGFYVALAGQYGDQRAVFHLNTLLEERKDLSPQDRQECLETIENLDGIPTAAARAAASPVGEDGTEAGKTGRNDPCPCGSGKKYKKCCGV